MALSYARRHTRKHGVGGGGLSEVQFRSGSGVPYTARTNTTIPAPAGIQDGDLLVLIFEIGIIAPPPVPTPPAGFAVLPNFPTSRADGLGNQVNTWVWQKLASGESGNYTVTHAAGNSTGFILDLFGQDGLVAIDPNPTVNSGIGTPATALGLTTVLDNSLVIWWGGMWDFGLVTPPVGATPTFISRFNTADSILHVATGTLATAGPTGNKDSTPPVTPFPWASGLIAVKPA